MSYQKPVRRNTLTALVLALIVVLVPTSIYVVRTGQTPPHESPPHEQNDR